MPRLHTMIRLLLGLHILRNTMASDVTIGIGSLGILPSLNNPCGLDLSDESLRTAYNVTGASYQLGPMIASIIGANNSIASIKNTSSDLRLCDHIPYIGEIPTFPNPLNFVGKTLPQALHSLHKELVYILAHWHFAHHEFSNYRDDCSSYHFTNEFGTSVSDSFGSFRILLCNLMRRIGYSSGVERNLQDLLGESHNTKRECSVMKNWTCILIKETQHALNSLFDVLRKEQEENLRTKKFLQRWPLYPSYYWNCKGLDYPNKYC